MVTLGITCDGSYRAGKSWCAFVVRTGKVRRKQVVHRECRELGYFWAPGPEYAEASAICYALLWVLKKRGRKEPVIILSDCQTVVNAILLGYWVTPSVMPIISYARYMLKELPLVALHWKPRKEVSIADHYIRSTQGNIK